MRDEELLFAYVHFYLLLCIQQIKERTSMKQTVWMVALLILAGSCTSESERWLERAEVSMETDPACAYGCLQQIGLADDGLTDEERARYALLQVQAMHKCRMPLTNDSLINVAVAYYQANNDKHMLAKALLYKGLVHKQNGQVEQAAEAFVASERNFAQVDDNQYKALLSDHYGMLLFNQAMYEKALHYFKLSPLTGGWQWCTTCWDTGTAPAPVTRTGFRMPTRKGSGRETIICYCKTMPHS